MRQALAFPGLRFPPNVYRQARAVWRGLIPSDLRYSVCNDMFTIVGGQHNDHRSEDQFLKDFPKASYAVVAHSAASGNSVFGTRGPAKYGCEIVMCDHGAFGGTIVNVEAPTKSIVASVLDVFRSSELRAQKILPRTTGKKQPETEIKIFLGHGRNTQWRMLKAHLEDQHGYKVVTFEYKARLGDTTQGVLEKMLNECQFAILVMTGENVDDKGKRHARENVIHESGLFQGKLGFKRAIVLREKNTEDFSNISAVTQGLFTPGNIQESYGDVLAAIQREFGRAAR